MSDVPSLRKPFLMFLAPMMLSNILQALFGTINSVYLGQMIGVHALAAASVFFPMMFLLVSFVVGLSSGASVLIGQAWGAREPAKVKAVAGATLTVALLLAGLTRSLAACSAASCSPRSPPHPTCWTLQASTPAS
jgi:Na+-driven multidrug efflux pump